VDWINVAQYRDRWRTLWTRYWSIGFHEQCPVSSLAEHTMNFLRRAELLASYCLHPCSFASRRQLKECISTTAFVFWLDYVLQSLSNSSLCKTLRYGTVQNVSWRFYGRTKYRISPLLQRAFSLCKPK
jgi:hypothetical protein